MEESQKRHQVRASCALGGQLPRIAPPRPAPLPSRRTSARGCDAGPYQPTSATLRRKIADMWLRLIFSLADSGAGGVAHQVRRLGFCAKEWDIEHGNRFDLMKPTVVKRLLKDIAAGRILAATLSPPDTSFSTARDRAKVLRSEQFPWGLPRHLLSEHESQRVILGNSWFETCFKVISCLQSYRVPWILEHPASSKRWFLPPMTPLLEQCLLLEVDLCQFGAPWKKRTKLLCGNFDLQDTARLLRGCGGVGGWCCKNKETTFSTHRFFQVSWGHPMDQSC